MAALGGRVSGGVRSGDAVVLNRLQISDFRLQI
jgi:hypothetical protein